MKIIYSAQAKEQLNQIKYYISKDNPKVAINYLLKIKSKIELLGKYPYIGKINSVYNLENIREFVILGYKVIYKINTKTILILAIYKYINFNENSIISQL